MMVTKIFPEFFVCSEIYEIVEKVLRKNLKSTDVEKVIQDLMRADAKPENFIKKLTVVLNKHTHVNKASNAIMDIKHELKELVGIEVTPRKIQMTKSEKVIVSVAIENKTSATLKFRVGIKQLDRTYTSVLFDPKQGYSFTKFIKTSIIPEGKMHVFKFQIKAEVFGIQDLYELTQKKKLMILLGIQADAEGIDGMISNPEKVEINYVKVKV